MFDIQLTEILQLACMNVNRRPVLFYYNHYPEKFFV